jgi:hypothetical protein
MDNHPRKMENPMHKCQSVSAVTTLAFTLLSALWPASASADFTYQITADTSSLNGTAGNLDFQFNPGDSSAEAATAVITNFQAVGGTLALSNVLTGDASGLLPGTLTLDNGTAYNDAFQGLTFGTSISFDLTLSGPALNSPGGNVGSSFAFSLYASDGVTPLLTTDTNGSVVTVNVNPDGTASVLTFAQSAGNNMPVASAAPVSSVPAPPSIVLLLSAVPAALVLWRRSR